MLTFVNVGDSMGCLAYFRFGYRKFRFREVNRGSFLVLGCCFMLCEDRIKGFGQASFVNISVCSGLKSCKTMLGGSVFGTGPCLG